MNKTLLLPILLLISLLSFSQSGTDGANQQVEITAFNDSLLNQLLLQKINDKRAQSQTEALSVNKILKDAAEDQTKFMAKYGEAEILQTGKMKTTEKRIAFYGGSTFGKEFVYKYSLKKGAKAQTYQKVADDVAFKWLKSKKIAFFLENSEYIFTGVSTKLGDDDRQKIYISFVLGNYKSMPSGIDRVSELKIPYSKKKYGLKTFDAKACKKAMAYKNLASLQKGLYMEGQVIYFETDRYKTFKKIMKASKDGIAVDVVQKDQYSCGGLNIVNNNTPWKGIMTKHLWAPKMHKKNMFKDKKDRKTKLKVVVAKLPKGIGENIEFNLIVIQNKHICADIIPNYVEDAALENSSKLDFLADTISTEAEIDYVPTVENTQLTFRVPFERNKSTYQESDIEPIIKSLKEPDFIIDNIEINAFSSIEGDIKSNKRLQIKRAESIELALKSFIATHDNIKKAKVTTDENWNLFKQDITGTEFDEMSSMTLVQAQENIKSKHLAKKLEPILKNHRYAEVKLDITYDIEGDKEQAYVLSRFNKSVEATDRIKALSIQKYIFKKVLSGEYDKQAVDGQIIPENSSFAGLLMNKYWLQKYLHEMSIDGDMCDKVHALYQLDNSNPYLFFNDVYCDINKTNLADEKRVNDLRQRMDDLYETNLSEKTIDALNLEYLFGIIDAVDTGAVTPELALVSLKKIKEVVDIKEMNWRNALKLSYLFIEHNDFNYSAKLLEPFLDDKNVFEEILFTYISLATYSSSRVSSNRFYTAVQKALIANPDRLKELFTSNRISPQVFDNQKVKDLLCKELKL